jgi:uncharacterized membrane protein
VDRELIDDGRDLPLRLTSTVDGSREILSTVASATITFAGIAFSIALLVFQLASSQYSPRVVHGLFRDPFNKRIIGVVVGTFAYCLTVLRSVRSTEDGADPLVPHLSTGVAVLLGVITVLAVVAFIDHAAHRMDVSEILQDVTRQTVAAADTAERATAPVHADPPSADGLPVRFEHNGWIQQIDRRALLDLVPPGGVVALQSAAGRYAVTGTTACTLWPAPERADRDDAAARARKAIRLGDTRTMQQDATYGLRQIVDVALKALSPGVNDPTTAQDSIFHAAAVLHTLLRGVEPKVVAGEDGRRLLLPEVPDEADLVALAFDEVRLAAHGNPAVSIYLLEAMRLLVDSLRHDGLHHAVEPILEQARRIRASVDRADLLPEDADRIRGAYERRFGPPSPTHHR